MRTIRSLVAYTVAAAAVASAMPAARASAAPADRKRAAREKERQLIGVLESNAPAKDKAIPCKQLAIYGSKAAVPALAALLPDKELASWARIALEAIPGPAADEALRDAVGKLKGRLLIGVINSIGVRRDARAVDALAQRLKDPDAGVASAAAEALGRIGGDRAANALKPSLATAPAGARSAVAYGCVLCAERFLAEGSAAEAVTLYDTVRKADVPPQRRLEATRGAILARGPAGVPLLVEQLRSPDKARFGLALRTARELAGGDVTGALVGEIGRARPPRQVLLLAALADRGDAKALPAMLDAARRGPADTRIVAIGVLERLGNASCAPVLLEGALDADDRVAAAAKATWARLPGEGVDADILARLPKAPAKARQVLLELAGRRQIAAALPAIVRYAEDADAGVRGAAVAAIGILGGTPQAADLVRVLRKTSDAKEQAGIEKALTAVSVRGGAACVPHLLPLTRSDSGALRIVALHALAAAGGPDALAAVKPAVEDKDEAVRDEAVRMLSNWPSKWPEDAGLAEPLLALAKSGKKVAHQVLGLRGYLQYLQRSRKLSDADRLAKARDVVPLARRVEEKRLVVSVLRNIRAAEALEILVGLASDRGVAEEACSAIVSLAGRRDLKGASKEQRRQALQVAVDKSRSRRLKGRAAAALKAIK